MKNKKLAHLLKYEFKNTMANFFTPFFGIVFPILMGSFLTSTISSGVPVAQQAQVETSIALMVALIIPLAIMLISFPALFAQETEQGVITRMELFGFKEKEIIIAKIIVHYTIVTCALILFSTVMISLHNIITPHWSALLIYLVCYYAIATLLFIFSYAVTMLVKKFGITFAIVMTLYFAIMIFSGMMGIQPDELPSWGQKIAYSLPLAHMSSDFHTYWGSGFTGYNFMPIIQSFIFMTAIVAIVYLISWQKRRRRLH
ncbi:ABC transporter permease [Paenibacillus yanchengensis]|uniref:ABC transporter permease n=1 Tax=Paenibacillus yanchengensis TaxID=2035833 RepID=A0ABW4YQX8_9BACL